MTVSVLKMMLMKVDVLVEDDLAPSDQSAYLHKCLADGHFLAPPPLLMRCIEPPNPNPCCPLPLPVVVLSSLARNSNT